MHLMSIDNQHCILLIVLAQDEVDRKGMSQKDVADNNQGIFFLFSSCKFLTFDQTYEAIRL